ncbi:hypothetical protein CRG98_010445 [Punica granatum]|uniref:Uncharacterized protein n=1 Tax=Punica granatum TaxID=22663 RepID=A0A2I0KKY7_PUNGR|nr:hypothetical protein CRG98_010445 [Punica granatum]
MGGILSLRMLVRRPETRSCHKRGKNGLVNERGSEGYDLKRAQQNRANRRREGVKPSGGNGRPLPSGYTTLPNGEEEGTAAVTARRAHSTYPTGLATMVRSRCSLRGPPPKPSDLSHLSEEDQHTEKVGLKSSRRKW